VVENVSLQFVLVQATSLLPSSYLPVIQHWREVFDNMGWVHLPLPLPLLAHIVEGILCQILLQFVLPCGSATHVQEQCEGTEHYQPQDDEELTAPPEILWHEEVGTTINFPLCSQKCSLCG
jgi:hypothetical protein